MAYTARDQVADVAKGAATGGAMAVGFGVAIAKGLPALASVAPRAASVVRGALSARVAVAVMGTGAIVGAVKAHQEGRSMVGGALGGALLIFPKKSEAAGFTPEQLAAAADRPAQMAETPAQARERLGKKFGGTPNDLKLAAQNDRANMAKATTQQQRDAYERRALLAEQEYERQTGQHIGPTAPAATPASSASSKSTVDKVLDFGRELINGKPTDKTDPFQQRRESLLRDQEVIRKQLAKGSTLRPDTLEAKRKNDEALAKLDKEERDANAGSKALAWSIGAVLGGGLIGAKMGNAVKATAEAGAAAAARGVQRVASGAARLVVSSPKGMLHGTIEGDKAAAAVRTAVHNLHVPHVSAAAAYGVPAVSGTVAAGSIAYATKNPDDPMAFALRTEGYFSGAMTVMALKGGIVARGIRSVVSPNALASVVAAEQRLVREARNGLSAVANQARGRVQTIRASSRATVAGVEAKAAAGVAEMQAKAAVGTAAVRATRDVKVVAANAQRSVGVARADARSTVQVAKHDGSHAAVQAGRRVGVAKANAATAVEKAHVQGRVAVDRAKQGQPVTHYKDYWTDKNGVTRHRMDLSIRRGRNPAPPANANAA